MYENNLFSAIIEKKEEKKTCCCSMTLRKKNNGIKINNIIMYSYKWNREKLVTAFERKREYVLVFLWNAIMKLFK